MSLRSKKLYNKNVFLSGGVDTNSIMKCVEDIFEIIEFNEAYEEPEAPINLIMNSPGGSVYDGFALIGIMETSPVPIHTYAYGQIMSMALPIFVSGHYRIASPYTTFMYHNISWDSQYEKLEWHRQELKEADRLQKLYDGIILKRTKLPKASMEDVIRTKSEWYFSPSEAKKFKVVDRVLTSKI
jgi:ATP-dependent Clp protease protease subunit